MLFEARPEARSPSGRRARRGGRRVDGAEAKASAQPEARAQRGHAVPPGRDGAARGGQRGAAGLERGGPLGQRGAAEHQRGAGDGEGGAAGEQRGAGDSQPGAAGPEPPARARPRVCERDRGDGAQSPADPERRLAGGTGEPELLRLLPGHGPGDGRAARLRAGGGSVGRARAAADAGRAPAQGRSGRGRRGRPRVPAGRAADADRQRAPASPRQRPGEHPPGLRGQDRGPEDRDRARGDPRPGAEGAAAGRGGRSDQGRVHVDPVARAAGAAQRDGGMGAGPGHRRPRRGHPGAREGGHRAQRPRADAAHRGPAGLLERRRGQAHPVPEADGPRAGGGRRDRGGPLRGRGQGDPPRSVDGRGGGAGPRRPGPAAAGPLERAVERGEVHAARGAGRSPGRTGRRLPSDPGERHRTGHLARLPPARVRAIPPAGRHVATRHGGLGLGLAIVKELVELHGGTVHADSPGEGQGATITVALPLPTSSPEPTGTALPLRSRDRGRRGPGR